MRGALGLLSIILFAGSLGCSKPPPTLPDGGDACSGDVRFVESNCQCQSSNDCRGKRPDGNSARWACTPAHACLAICTSTADCLSGEVCEDLICRPGGVCDGPNSCPAGKQCIGGSCQTPIPAVARCKVLPATTVMNAGSTRSFSVVGFDKDGTAIPYDRVVAWSVTDLGASTSDTGVSARFVVDGAAVAGSGRVQATIGSVSCAASSVVQYAPPAAGVLRVVVVSRGETATSADGIPLAGAVVVVDNGGSRITGNDGAALFDGLGGSRHDISVFAPDHSYVTVLQTNASDVLIPLKALPAPARFTGQWQASHFDNLSDPSGTLHVSISGASIGGALIDLSVQRLLGQTQSMLLDLGLPVPLGPYAVPEGVALGLDQKMFGDDGGGHFGIQVAPGTRALWTFGGNAILGDVLKAVGPLLGGGDAAQQIAGILTAFLPLIGTLESGVTSGLSVEPDAAATVTIGGAGVAVRPTTLLRMKADVQTPTLPVFADDSGASTALDSLLVVGGVQMPEQGFVPLGLTAGFDRKDTNGGDSPDQRTDPVGPNGAAQHLPLRLAPRHGGIETGPLAFVTLAVSTPTIATLFAHSAETAPLVLAGRVSRFVAGTTTPYALQYTSGAAPAMDLSQSFLAVPGAATVPAGTREIDVSSMPDGATFGRIDVGPDDQLWSIYFPPGTSVVSVPVVPAAFDDHFTGATLLNPTPPTTPPQTMLHAISLGYAPPGQSTALSYDGLWQFSGVDAADLSLEMDAFSSRKVARPVAAP